jgi:hypothetical protein
LKRLRNGGRSINFPADNQTSEYDLKKLNVQLKPGIEYVVFATSNRDPQAQGSGCEWDTMGAMQAGGSPRPNPSS